VVEERPDVQRVSFLDGLTLQFITFTHRTLCQQALNRLTPLESYDRAWRFKLASQASILHKPLPKEQWVKPEQASFLRLAYG
jgi:ubiquinol-cytochrome c reductase subunit 7